MVHYVPIKERYYKMNEMSELDKILDTMYRAMVKIDQKQLGADLVQYCYDYKDEYEIADLLED